MSSRRNLLAIIASTPAVAQHAGHDEAPASAYTPKVLTGSELRLLAQLVDLIIPRTDTPGASDAGVHYIVDRALDGKPAAAKTFRSGLRKFAKLDAAAQVAALKRMHAAKDPFFKQLKDLTVDGYYTTREGLAQELGWKGYTPMAEFPGCTHAEHQA